MGGFLRLPAQGVEGKPRPPKLYKQFFERDTLKPAVMNYPYGMTLYGMRKAIREQLLEAGFPRDIAYPGAKWLGYWVGGMIRHLAPQVHLGLSWLRCCAEAIAGQGNAIGWTSPVGMPVKQVPEKQHIIRGSGYSLTINERREDGPLDVDDQIDGFAANFVHSLDAAHMMRVALACQAEDIEFAAVHDCFWTHAADMERLNKILREEFIRLHKHPLLEVLHTELQKKYPGVVDLPTPPEVGGFDLNRVRDSSYFFA